MGLLINEKGFKVFPSGYRVNKSLVRLTCIILFVYLGFTAYSILSNDRFYLTCVSPDGCENPLYNYDDCVKIGASESLCSQERLSYGSSYGFKHSSFIVNAPIYSILLLLLMFVFNHFKYNKGRGFKDVEV